MFLEIFGIFKAIGQAFQTFWWIVFPVAFYILFIYMWKFYVWKRFIRDVGFTVLEIIPSREIEKSPKIVESLFESLYAVISSKTVFNEYVNGDLYWPSFSFELASIEGSVHFFVRFQSRWKNLVEANFYAKYPDIEIKEVGDYTLDVPKVIPNKEWDLWGCDFYMGKTDPIPIRTYKNFEETITGTMIDPLSAILEVMGKLGPNQQIWFQLIAQPISDTPEKWFGPGKDEVDKILDRAKERASIFGGVGKDISDVISGIPKGLFGGEIEFEEVKKEEKRAKTMIELTPGEQEIVKSIEENIGKAGYRTKMRFIYLGKRENFDKASGVGGFLGSLNQFNDLNLNEFKIDDKSKTYAWFFMVNSRADWRKRRIFFRYRDRDQDGRVFYMSAAELATVYHMPDMSVVAPTLSRVEAKKGGAPTNLPI